MTKLFYGNGIATIEGSDIRGVQIKYRGAISIKQTANNNFAITANENKIIMDIYLEKGLTEYLSVSGVKSFFTKHLNPELGVGDLSTIEDDVDFYIKSNILPRYKVEETNLFTMVSDDEELNSKFPIVNSELGDIEKQLVGLSKTTSFRIKKLDSSNNFNFRLIYNTRPGEYNSIAPSFKITKI